MIDIGTNLAHKSFRPDLDRVLARARAAGVHAIVATGTSVAASHATWEIAQTQRRAVDANRAPLDAPVVYSTAGVHPHEASRWSPAAEADVRDLATRPEVVAIGECGLDFDRNFSPRDAQIQCFEAQLEVAAELALPVFLHERKAHEDFVRILTRVRPRLARAVIHCFTGGEDEVARYLDLDLHVGVTGWICDDRRATSLRASVRRVPRDRLMIETDAPFLLPRDIPPGERPAAGRNEPCFLLHVLAAVAAARGESPEDVEQSTDATARAFFGIA
jgi:TatD DNase family protein